jgi:hypothetical protein
MSVFNIAIHILFKDMNLTVEALFSPLQGGSKIIRVITHSPDHYQNVGLSVIESPSLILEVQVSDCPIVSQGDQFSLESGTYTVQGEPRRDAEDLFWKVDCYAS